MEGAVHGCGKSRDKARTVNRDEETESALGHVDAQRDEVGRCSLAVSGLGGKMAAMHPLNIDATGVGLEGDYHWNSVAKVLRRTRDSNSRSQCVIRRMKLVVCRKLYDRPGLKVGSTTSRDIWFAMNVSLIRS